MHPTNFPEAPLYFIDQTSVPFWSHEGIALDAYALQFFCWIGTTCVLPRYLGWHDLTLMLEKKYLCRLWYCFGWNNGRMIEARFVVLGQIEDEGLSQQTNKPPCHVCGLTSSLMIRMPCHIRRGVADGVSLLLVRTVVIIIWASGFQRTNGCQSSLEMERMLAWCWNICSLPWWNIGIRLWVDVDSLLFLFPGSGL